MAPGWSPEGWNGETTSKSATTREYREGVSGSAGGCVEGASREFWRRGGFCQAHRAYAGAMAMDSYYTDRFDKYEADKGVYHVLYSCPQGMAIKEK